MIHVPGERVWQKLCSISCVFTVNLGEDNIPTIIYKNHSLLLKRFSLGQILNIKMFKIMYEDKNYILLIHHLENDKNFYHYFIYSKEEYDSIVSLITSTKNYCFLFDETNSSQAGCTNINIKYNTCNLDTLKNVNFELYKYSDTVQNYSSIFDNIEKLYYENKGILLVDMEIKSTNWEKSTAHFLSNTGQATKVSVLDNDEGSIFNDQVATLLIQLFDDSIFLNPFTQIDKSKRELTDVLCIDNDCLLFIEAKVQSVFIERNPIKINNSILKNVDKAIRQLSGANNWYRKKCKIFDNKDNIINVPYGLFTFNIIVVSEFPEFDDDTFNLVEKTCKEENIVIVILDIEALAKIIKCTKGNKEILYTNLLGIFKSCMKNKSLNFEIEIPSKK